MSSQRFNPHAYSGLITNKNTQRRPDALSYITYSQSLARPLQSFGARPAQHEWWPLLPFKQSKQSSQPLRHTPNQSSGKQRTELLLCPKVMSKAVLKGWEQRNILLLTAQQCTLAWNEPNQH